MSNLTDEERKLQYSFSRISCYETCPYSYYLKYVKHEPESQNSMAQFGTYCHTILEKYFNGELELFELSDYYEEHFDDEVTLEFPLMTHRPDICLGERYFNGGLSYFENFQGYEGYEVIGSELEFVVPLFDNYKFHGFIDLLLKDPLGKFVIVDHKSRSKFKSKAEQKKYSRQLILYALYVKSIYGEYPDRVVFNMFRIGEIVKIKFDVAALEEAVQWAKDSIKKIEAESEWIAKPSPFFCNELCGFKKTCNRKDGASNQR